VHTLLAEQAHSELADITGLNFGKDQAAWNGWLSQNRNTLIPKPWMSPTDAVRSWAETILVEE
jgi:hypothetical protein